MRATHFDRSISNIFDLESRGMNRRRRFISGGLTLAIFVSLGVALLPPASQCFSASPADHLVQHESATKAVHVATVLFPGSAKGWQSDAGTPQHLDRLQAEIAAAQLPGCDATIRWVETCCWKRCGSHQGASLQSLKIRWQV